MTIKSNIEKLQKDISDICRNCGRDEKDIKIIAVSKTKPISMIQEAIASGLYDFGENYIQEAEEKFALLNNEDIRFHFIGSLQTNKVKHVTRFCSLLHSLDRENLAEALQKRLKLENKTINALFQINTSGEATKAGAKPEEAIPIARNISSYNRIKIKGLMTIAENSSNEDQIRKNYKQLRILSQELKALDYPNFDMKELSMGMSSDYRIAIEEGATMIRIGSNIFGSRG